MKAKNLCKGILHSKVAMSMLVALFSASTVCAQDNVKANTADSTNVKTAMEELGALTVDSASSSVESLGSAATDTATDVDAAKSAVDALNGATADSAASSVSSVGSAASGAADKVDDVKSAMEKLDGTTATVTINVKQNGSIPDGAKVDKNAEGGIYDGAYNVIKLAVEGKF